MRMINLAKLGSMLIVSTVFLGVGCSSSPKEPSFSEKHISGSEISSKSARAVDYKTAALLNVQLGLDYLAANQVDRAKNKLFKAQHLSPNLPELYVAFGQYYDKIGETALAETAYLKAISLKPGSGAAYNTYGTFLCRYGKYDKADKQFRRALEDKQYTQMAMILENAGLCALENKSTGKAKAYFERTLRQDPNRPHALIELSAIKFNEKAFEESQLLYKRYVMLEQQNARSLELGIKLAKHFHDKDKEASYLLLLRTQYPDSAEYKNNRYF